MNPTHKVNLRSLVPLVKLQNGIIINKTRCKSRTHSRISGCFLGSKHQPLQKFYCNLRNSYSLKCTILMGAKTCSKTCETWNTHQKNVKPTSDVKILGYILCWFEYGCLKMPGSAPHHAQSAQISYVWQSFSLRTCVTGVQVILSGVRALCDKSSFDFHEIFVMFYVVRDMMFEWEFSSAS